MVRSVKLVCLTFVFFVPFIFPQKKNLVVYDRHPVDISLNMDSSIPKLVATMSPFGKSVIDVGENITFDLTGSEDEQGIDGFMIDFGDGTIESWTQNSKFTYSYDAPGSYEVIIWVRDPAGNTASRTVTINVGEEAVPALVENKDGGVSILLMAGIAGIALLLLVGVIEGFILVRSRKRDAQPQNNVKPLLTFNLKNQS